ncbi:MAG: GTPase HflX, partial [Nitrospinales bacterium]
MKSRTSKIKSPMRKAVLVGVQLPHNGRSSMQTSLEELKGLAETAFYQPVAVFTQRLAAINAKTFLGSGKVDELLHAVRFHDAEVVIFDEPLAPAQNRNLEKMFQCRVIDRPWLILEIFSDHAKTREAKTQVELARLKYALPRLSKLWGHLSRQRGGIGLRDVGETQIQLDRRLTRDNITKLERQLKRIDHEKQVQRKSRRNTYKVALVGYTNVGKSTLMNRLTDAATGVADQLFATLDSTTRKIKGNFPYPVLVSDTVGLIDKLPHDLVASFKSTLDEVRDADLLLKVVDAGHPDFRNQMNTADQLLNELGAASTDALTVFNKTDTVADKEALAGLARQYPRAVFVCGRSGRGIPDLRRAITHCYEKRLTACRVKLEHAQAKLVDAIRKTALIVDTEYTETHVILKLKIPHHARAKVAEILNGNGAIV